MRHIAQRNRLKSTINFPEKILIFYAKNNNELNKFDTKISAVALQEKYQKKFIIAY